LSSSFLVIVGVIVVGGVGSASELGVVPLVVIVQRAGESLQEMIAVRESAIVVVVIMVVFIVMVSVSSLLQEGRGMSRGA